MSTAKRRLRAILRRRLAKVPAAEARAAAARMAERALELPELADARAVLVCLSFGVEPDTAPLIERLMEDRELFVPRVDGDRMTVHRSPCPLETLPFGLRQPPSGTPEEDPESLDIVLLPGLAFDLDGYRLGHGKGHFDRFLDRWRLPAAGYAYELQIEQRLPAEAHDRRMFAVVTDRRILRPDRA